MLKVEVDIIKLETGEVRTHKEEWEEEWCGDLEHPEWTIIFQWTENNNDCDCNRKAFFEEAADEGDDEYAKIVEPSDPHEAWELHKQFYPCGNLKYAIRQIRVNDRIVWKLKKIIYHETHFEEIGERL